MTDLDRVCLNAIIAILEDGGYANLVLKEQSAKLDSEKSRAVYACVYTLLEHLLTLDYILSHYCARQKRVVRNILRLALCRLLYMNVPPYAVVDSAVALCKRTGKRESGGLVNAVLRKIAADAPAALPKLPSDPILRLSLEFSYPEWLVRHFAGFLGLDGTRALFSAPKTGMELRAQHPFTTDELAAALPVPFEPGSIVSDCLRLKQGLDIEKFLPFIEGKCTVQSQGSMCVCRAIGELHGKTVLDACAAPGGKSAYIYSLSGGTANIYARDLAPHRVELIKSTLARLSVPANVRLGDAAVYDPALEKSFDVVLLDVPCSGLGLLNEKPDIRYKKSEADIRSLAELQSAILGICCAYVKPGGLLVYSTCTISPVENERQVELFLKGHGNFAPVPGKMRQLMPHTDGVDGFFYAVLKRCS
ncbi:MAG: 16S rRNA (cytosine(967)-C(5))-methyltransferase RsmB [Clostridia bacterium]|nr:16S rRNA (cytosine(967)-C(5))-methyltransferase RsmB [Clostridia bacterium]